MSQKGVPSRRRKKRGYHEVSYAMGRPREDLKQLTDSENERQWASSPGMNSVEKEGGSLADAEGTGKWRVEIVPLNYSFLLSVQAGFFSSDWAICFSLCRVPPSQVQNCQQTEFLKIKKKKSSLVEWNQKRGIRIMGWRISWNYRTTQWPLPTLFRDYFSSVQIVQDPQAREWTLASLMFLITS